MTISIADREALWQEFLNRWPLESLSALTLEQYSEPGNQDSFCNWLEGRTTDLGSVWGGSSFKFGVYVRSNLEERVNGKGRCYDDKYGWMAKYGDTPKKAFDSVKGEIIKVAKAARQGDLAQIEAADLGEAIKWKLAFLYQDKNNLKIVPLYKADYMRLLLDSRERIFSRLQEQLVAMMGSENVWQFTERQLQTIDKKLSTELTPAQAMNYLNGLPQWNSTGEPTKYIAGYEAENGRQLALVRENRRTTIFVSDGDWLNYLNGQLESVAHYPAEKSRNSNLRSQAPLLYQGHPAVSVVVPTLKVLESLCDLYAENIDSNYQELQVEKNTQMERAASPLNQILFGPPGTGKTYSTIDTALEILDPNFLIENVGDRTALKTRFDEFINNQDIRFVTFHQSLSYEDFVEGLAATTDDGKISYEVKPGIFKQLCDAALAKVIKRQDTNINLAGKHIWKMSLGNTQGDDAYIFQECIEQNRILLGYGDELDFSHCKDRAAVHEHFVASGRTELSRNSYEVTAVSTLVSRMSIGDLVVVSEGNYKFRAIGEITSDYQFIDRSSQDGYNQSRSVRWLRVYQPGLPNEQLMNNAFSQMTLYELRDTSINHDKLRALFSDPQERDDKQRAKVLIIDEINRGNIAKIFGELITLIEPSKRKVVEPKDKKGDEETLEVVLPYSKTTFSVPANVYIIGTMNTSDRSLAGLDIALRRRFTFKEMPPKPELLDGVEIEGINIGELLAVMNQRIDVLLGRDYCLGHAYFMSLTNDSTLSDLAAIFQKQIFPLLQEYFFEDWQRIQWVLNDHRKTTNQFVTRQTINDLNDLFGGDVTISDHQLPWIINKDAFVSADAYKGIIKAVNP